MMRAAAFMLAVVSAPALALPPVTQAEAVAFHTSGLCSMQEPGDGVRADGQGWIVSMLPGKHMLYAKGGIVTVRGHADSFALDMDVGRPYRISVSPAGAPVFWCVPFAPQGRDRCGPVPTAFLYQPKEAR